MSNKFPIRYKFLLVTTVLLVFSVVSYLFLASHIFRRDKIELVFDLNRGAVSSLGSEVESVFGGIADKMRLAAVLSQDSSARSKALMSDVLDNDASIVFAVASYGFQKFDQVLFSDKQFAETYGLKESFFTKELTKTRAVPFDEIQTTGESVWNASVKDGPPLIGFGKSVVPETGGGSSQAAPFAMIVYIRSDLLLRAFSGSRLNEIIAVNRKGEPLIHSKPELLSQAKSLLGHPLFETAKLNQVRTGVRQFEHQGREYLGAYSTSYGGRIMILSQIDGGHAFAAVRRLVNNSVIFASIAITLAFLAAIFFSRSLTRPIQALTDTMARVSRGELDTAINIKTRDEIAILANSFNKMIVDLRTSRLQLEEVNRDLEQKVKDRTRRLEEQNLAVKKAQEALLQTTRLATVGEVAGRAAHEVLNPLTGIVARLERVRSRVQHSAVQEVQLMKTIVESWETDYQSGGFPKLVDSWQTSSKVNPTQSLWQEDIENFRRMEQVMDSELKTLVSDVEFILKESQRINKIVQNMRALTRVRDDMKAHSVGELLCDSAKIMIDLAEHHNIQIIESLHANPDEVILDRDEFLQCMTNLIRNSIQAIEDRRRHGWSGTGRIELKTSVVDSILHLEVSDNGNGIAPDNAAKLFEMQFTTKQSDEGTGLGLTITRRFIRDFGGDIVLKHSAPQEGCVFLISLPLRELESNEQRRVA